MKHVSLSLIFGKKRSGVALKFEFLRSKENAKSFIQNSISYNVDTQ